MSDTPTLLANASAGQLIADAMCAERYAAADAQPVHRDSLLRLAELARAVVALECEPDFSIQRIDPENVFVFFASQKARQHVEHKTLCAALASTRHTQGEPDA